MPVCGRGRYGYMASILVVAASLAVAGFLLAGCGGDDGQKAASSVPVEQGAEELRQAAARVVNACQGTARASTACAEQISELETLVKGSGPSPQIGTGGPTLRACNDGDDNDGDGLIDSPEDPGCSSGTDNDEYNAPPTTTAPPATTTQPPTTTAPPTSTTPRSNIRVTAITVSPNSVRGGQTTYVRLELEHAPTWPLDTHVYVFTSSNGPYPSGLDVVFQSGEKVRAWYTPPTQTVTATTEVRFWAEAAGCYPTGTYERCKEVVLTVRPS
jgi:hypothetical protein